MMSEIIHTVWAKASVTGRAKTICCKKVDHFSDILCKYKSKKPKPAAKTF